MANNCTWVLVGGGQHRLVKGTNSRAYDHYQGTVVSVHGKAMIFASDDRYLGQRKSLLIAQQYLEDLFTTYGDTCKGPSK
jgi:hypothetical protein